MHRVPEPRPVEQIAQSRERSVDGAEETLHEVAERVGPHGLRIQQRLEPAAEHAPRFYER